MSSTAAPQTPTTPGSPQVPGGPNYTPASLYVGDLKPDVGEALLFDIFNTVGPVASIRVCRDVITRRSLGYAYVNFHSVADAERAHDTMNFQQIRGHPCRIMWSQRDPSLRKSGVGNIFVKNLDKTIDHKTLYDTFSMFGNILSCKVAMSDKGESLGYGFVHYETLDSAQKAIDKVNGMVIAGNEVHVAPFRSKTQRAGPDKTTFTNVYVKSFTPDMDSKEKFEEIMKEFGAVTSVSLPIDEVTGKPKGFGFVNFENPEDAAKCVDKMTETGQMYAGRAQKKEERERELRERFDALRIQQAEKFHGVNLYIKNLDDTIDDDQLKNEFKEFGEITSAKVMRDGNGRSKGFGFVCFTTKEEAAKCVSEMNGRVMCGKPLYVTTAQRKEIRRQQLEAQAQVNRSKLTAGLPPPMPYGPPGMYYQQPPTGPGQMPRGPAPGFMYTQQMMAQQRWNPRQAQSPHMIAMPPRGPAQQPMPNIYMNNLAMQQQYQQQQQQQARGMGPVGRGGGRGGPGGRGSVMKPQQPRQQPGPQGPSGPNVGPGGVPMQQTQDSRIKFAPNVRNQPVAGGQPVANGQPMAGNQQQGGPVDPQAQQQRPAGPPGPLTSQALAQAPTQQQKQMIGERIFPLIQERQPDLAGKITGMLLEMDNTELLHLLENREALNEKIAEALAVLEQHQTHDPPQQKPNAAVADPQAA